MKELNSERIITPMPAGLVEAIDKYKWRARLSSRAEAIRLLLRRGLEGEREDRRAALEARRQTAPESGQ